MGYIKNIFTSVGSRFVDNIDNLMDVVTTLEAYFDARKRVAPSRLEERERTVLRKIFDSLTGAVGEAIKTVDALYNSIIDTFPELPENERKKFKEKTAESIKMMMDIVYYELPPVKPKTFEEAVDYLKRLKGLLKTLRKNFETYFEGVGSAIEKSIFKEIEREAKERSDEKLHRDVL